MMKKIVLLLALAISFGFVQNTGFAQDKYGKTFYLENMQKNIESCWILPNDAKGKSAVVKFTLNKDGHVTGVELLRSSNDSKFDDSVIAAVCKNLTYGNLADDKVPNTFQVFFSPAFTDIAVLNPVEQGLGTKDTHIQNVANRKSYVDFSSYTNDLESRIDANWVPKTSKKVRDAIVSVDIDKDGSLKNIEIIKSSRRKKFDSDIVDAISKAVPMETLPAGFKSDSATIQLVFNYSKQDNVNIPTHYVSANVNNIKGYDEYTKLVQKVIANRVDDKRYFFYKDLVLEIVINKDGKLNYVKVQRPSKDKNFDRKIIADLQMASFPPIPKETGLDSIKLNYELVTQRKRMLKDFICDYLAYGFRTRLKSFAL